MWLLLGDGFFSAHNFVAQFVVFLSMNAKLIPLYYKMIFHVCFKDNTQRKDFVEIIYTRVELW